MFNRIVSPAVRTMLVRQSNVNVRAQQRAAYHAEDIKPPSMDDLPVPCGSWETQYKTNQSKYNMHLAAGVIFAAFTFIAAKASGLMFMNYYPPPYPFEK